MVQGYQVQGSKWIPKGGKCGPWLHFPSLGVHFDDLLVFLRVWLFVQRTNTLYYENFIVIISMFFSTEQWQLIHSGIVLLENFSAFFKNENCGPSVVVHLFVAWSRSVTRKHSQAFTKLIYHRISCYHFWLCACCTAKGAYFHNIYVFWSGLDVHTTSLH